MGCAVYIWHRLASSWALGAVFIGLHAGLLHRISLVGRAFVLGFELGLFDACGSACGAQRVCACLQEVSNIQIILAVP